MWRNKTIVQEENNFERKKMTNKKGNREIIEGKIITLIFIKIMYFREIENFIHILFFTYFKNKI